MLRPLHSSRKAVAAVRAWILGRFVRAELPADPFGLPPERQSAAAAAEADRTRIAIENTIPQNFMGSATFTGL